MKRLLLLTGAVFLVFFSNSQESVDPLIDQTLEKYGLSLNDNRGLVLFYQVDQICIEQAESTKEAIEKFFLQSPKKDITYICVKNESLTELSGVILDIHAIIHLYLNNTIQY